MKKQCILLSLVMFSVHAMDIGELEMAQSSGTQEAQEQMYVQAIKDKLGLDELEGGEQLLKYLQQQKDADEYQAFIKKFTGRSRRKKKGEMALLYKALIAAQAEHTSELKRQIELQRSLADRSSISTQKALCVSRWRLCAAVTAVCFTAVSFTMNILQALKVVGASE